MILCTVIRSLFCSKIGIEGDNGIDDIMYSHKKLILQ